MSKIPTAEEFLNQKQFNPDLGITFEEYHGDNISWTTQKAMIETDNSFEVKSEATNKMLELVTKESILTAYPIDNIK